MIVLVALFHGWMAYASIASTSHAPSAWTAHGGVLPAAEPYDHGHSHDESGSDDRAAGHQHGHNAADHSHDKLNLPRTGTYAAGMSTDVWSTVNQVQVHPGPYFPFERPPKTVPML